MSKTQGQSTLIAQTTSTSLINQLIPFFICHDYNSMIKTNNPSVYFFSEFSKIVQFSQTIFEKLKTLYYFFHQR